MDDYTLSKIWLQILIVHNPLKIDFSKELIFQWGWPSRSHLQDFQSSDVLQTYGKRFWRQEYAKWTVWFFFEIIFLTQLLHLRSKQIPQNGALAADMKKNAPGVYRTTPWNRLVFFSENGENKSIPLTNCCKIITSVFDKFLI